MALLTETKTIGALNVILYHFEKAGDELPVHIHVDERNNHISLISAGSFRCIGDRGISGSVLTTGMVVDWPAGQAHGFVALEDNARMIQVGKYPAVCITTVRDT